MTIYVRKGLILVFNNPYDFLAKYEMNQKSINFLGKTGIYYLETKDYTKITITKFLNASKLPINETKTIYFAALDVKRTFSCQTMDIYSGIGTFLNIKAYSSDVNISLKKTHINSANFCFFISSPYIMNYTVYEHSDSLRLQPLNETTRHISITNRKSVFMISHMSSDSRTGDYLYITKPMINDQTQNKSFIDSGINQIMLKVKVQDL